MEPGALPDALLLEGRPDRCGLQARVWKAVCQRLCGERVRRDGLVGVRVIDLKLALNGNGNYAYISTGSAMVPFTEKVPHKASTQMSEAELLVILRV